MRTARWLASALLALALAASATAQSPLRPTQRPLPGAPATPAPAEEPSARAPVAPAPTVRLGALLPLAGPAAWFGSEMRRGMELAAADLDPAPRSPAPAAAPGDDRISSAGAESGPVGTEAPGFPRVRVDLDIADVPTLDVKVAAAEFARLAAAGAVAVLTASPTPTLAIQPLAAARDVLVVHQGLPAGRGATGGRGLLQLRPSLAARAETLAALAWDRGYRRLALLAAGDDTGRAARVALAARWQGLGGSLAHAESLSFEAPDLGARLAQLARLAPDAVMLVFRGPDVGEAARRLRAAGYPGPLLAPDDDPAALLAAGPAVADLWLLADAFAPGPGSRAARFAEAYEAKFKQPPSRFAAGAYDAVVMLAQGVRQRLGEGRGAPGGARLREILVARGTFPSLFGGTLRLRDDGTIERPLSLHRAEDGRLVFVHYVSTTGRRVSDPVVAAP